jgi:hypothetical protein
MHTLEKIRESIRTLAPKWNLTVTETPGKVAVGETLEVDVRGADFDLQFYFRDSEYVDWTGGPLEKPGALAFLKAVFEYPL